MARGKSIVQPDFTVVVSKHDGTEVLVAALFIEETGKVDVGVGWDGTTELLGVRAILESVSLSLTGVVSWADAAGMVDANQRAASEGDEIPF